VLTLDGPAECSADDELFHTDSTVALYARTTARPWLTIGVHKEEQGGASG
jgi:hypothetical protein